jgi:hypothetical protein
VKALMAKSTGCDIFVIWGILHTFTKKLYLLVFEGCKTTKLAAMVITLMNGFDPVFRQIGRILDKNFPRI